MVSPDDIVEIVLEALKRDTPGKENFRKELEKESGKKGRWGFHVKEPYLKPYTSLPARKIFLSEYEIKQMLKDGKKELRLPASAILSPLALEWLAEKGIKIVRS